MLCYTPTIDTKTKTTTPAKTPLHWWWGGALAHPHHTAGSSSFMQRFEMQKRGIHKLFLVLQSYYYKPDGPILPAPWGILVMHSMWNTVCSSWVFSNAETLWDFYCKEKIAIAPWGTWVHSAIKVLRLCPGVCSKLAWLPLIMLPFLCG